MVKVVVTGGTGFIGSHLVEALIARGDEVHAIDTGVAGVHAHRTHEKATYHTADIRDRVAVGAIIDGARYVFHEAALPRVQYSIEHPIETFDVNVTGLIVLLEASHQVGVRKFINASSGSVYGDQETLPLVETMQARPKSPYGLQKYMGEEACRVWSDVYHLPTISLRYFNVYGSRMDPNGAYALAIAKFIQQRKEGKPMTIWGDGSHSRDFTHVRDVVRANLLAAESDVAGGETFNIGAGRNRTVNELASLIGGPTVNEPERLEPAHALADNTKARTLLGWQPQISLEEGIAELKAEAGLT